MGIRVLFVPIGGDIVEWKRRWRQEKSGEDMKDVKRGEKGICEPGGDLENGERREGRDENRTDYLEEDIGTEPERV